MRLCGPCLPFIVTLISVAPGFAISAEPVPDFGRDISPIFAQTARNVMALRSSFLVTASTSAGKSHEGWRVGRSGHRGRQTGR